MMGWALGSARTHGLAAALYPRSQHHHGAIIDEPPSLFVAYGPALLPSAGHVKLSGRRGSRFTLLTGIGFHFRSPAATKTIENTPSLIRHGDTVRSVGEHAA